MPASGRGASVLPRPGGVPTPSGRVRRLREAVPPRREPQRGAAAGIPAAKREAGVRGARADARVRAGVAQDGHRQRRRRRRPVRLPGQPHLTLYYVATVESKKTSMHACMQTPFLTEDMHVFLDVQ